PSVLAVTPLAREATLALTSDVPRTAESRERLRRVIIDDLTAAPAQPLHLPEPRDERLRALTHLVEQEMEGPATLAQLGRRIGAGERTLSRLFQQTTGMSFRRWRRQQRTPRALLLPTGRLSVVATATAGGGGT